MNKYILKLTVATLLIGLITGCSSKKDNISYNDNLNSETINENIDDKINNNLDNKLSDIQTIKTKVIGESVSKIGNNSYYNTVTSSINGQEVTLTSIHFAFGAYKMNDEMESITKSNAKLISPIFNNSKARIKLEGNCDEWGNDEFNFALGLKRAKTVKDSLVNNGIKGSNIIILSLGEGNPICKDQTASCWKKNRRVDHRFIQ